MPDDMSPLAAALRDEDRAYLGAHKSAAYWNTLAITARAHLRAAPPAPPPERPTCATCVYLNGDFCQRNAPRYISHDPGMGNDWAEVDKYNDFCGDHPDFPAWIAAREGGR